MKRFTRSSFYFVCLALLLFLSVHASQSLEKRTPAQIGVAVRSLAGQGVGFTAGATGPQDRRVTDPVSAWHTYMGSAADDYSSAIALDTNGNIYLAGWSAATWGTPINPYSGGQDCFVAKLNSSGVLLWNTFLGSAGDDYGRGVAVDAGGNIYVVGYGNATWGTPVNPYAGGDDCFVAKLNSSGVLAWNTFMGSSGNEYGYDIALDTGGNTYVGGWSGGIWGTPVNDYVAGTDAFVAKVDSNGARVWNTFMGGAEVDSCHSIDVDTSGNIYAAGRSYATWGWPVNAYAGDADAFAAKLNNDGSRLWNTFLGSTSTDEGSAVAVDASGNIYVTGSSDATWGTPVNPYAGMGDSYAAKLNSNGVRIWNTFMGSATGGEMGLSVAVNTKGDVFIIGNGNVIWGSPIYPFITSVFACITKLNNGGARLWNAFNRALPERSSCVAVDAGGNIYMGCTADVLWGTPVNPLAGGRDGFVAKFTEEPIWKPKHAVGDFNGDGSDGIAADFGSNGAWIWENGSWTQLTANNPESMIAANIDGNADDEIVTDLGAGGLWLWNGGTWTELSALNAEMMTAGDIDADGSDELIGDFGATGLWLWGGGAWTELSGVDAGYITTANLDGTGGAEIIGDFGAVGLWAWNGGVWTQLSGVSADYLAAGNTDGLGGADLVGGFGALGLWMLSNDAWAQLSGANPDNMVTADVDGNGDDEVFGDFWTIGLWLWDSWTWTQLSGLDPELMVAADVDGNGDGELAADFGLLGLWLWDSGSWSQLSGNSPKTLLAGDVDGDGHDELIVDFAALGLWVWNDRVWSQLTAEYPD
jgi:hypothetical protein